MASFLFALRFWTCALAVYSALTPTAGSAAPKQQAASRTPPAGSGTRADAAGVDGIYHGRIGMQLDTQKGKIYDAPARFVVLPNGKSALLTAQHPGGVLTVILNGELRGRTFYATTRGRDDFGGHHYGMTWDITFDRSAGTATLHGKAIKRPRWAMDDDLRFTFRKKQ